MECEVCGSEIRGKPMLVRIEGSLMRTCERCAKLGVVERAPSPAPKAAKPLPQRLSRPPRIEPAEPEIVENYAELIRHAREKAGLTREDFGKKINEKASIIARLESRAMVPDAKLARKLEKALGITLFELARESKLEGFKGASEELTIGDMIKIKKR